MSTTFSKILKVLSYLVVFIKKVNLLGLQKFMNFSEQPSEVFYEKNCS